ncbi:polyphosphate:nucleotide phosphotransferase, PPK2 family [Hyaloraphidium curvatum]|nr:polyphosphate:nucleotide phosphotransferase, PPK2 family [Hyaloraphidium curvatum]
MSSATPFSDRHRIPADGKFRVADAPSFPDPSYPTGKQAKHLLEDVVDALEELQDVLYADARYSLLVIFQAMDASGKDSTVKAVLSGVNPAGCQVYSFKSPSKEELAHDFLWRTYEKFPERGRIGIFNRSYYEEVLVVRVHQNILANQNLPDDVTQPPEMWKERFESITNMEQHLARNGTKILKFWLNVSRDEQRNRLIKRLEDPAKNWKFEKNDLRERDLWPKYMEAYEDLINHTSKDYAPWFCIPADEKKYMQLSVASIIRETLAALPLRYPASDPEIQKEKHELIDALLAQPTYNPELKALKEKAKEADKAWEKAQKADEKEEKQKKKEAKEQKKEAQG